MSDSSVDDFFSRQAQEARGPEAQRPVRRKKKRARRLRRIALASALSLVVLAAGIVVAGYLTVNHIASSVHRIHGIMALDAADQPVVPAAFRRGMTVLLTDSGVMPGAADVRSGLIALVHLNANQRGGAVVSIPADVLVNIPGHGRMELWNAEKIGGPSLLIRIVEDLTNVRIDHYSVMDFQGATKVAGAMGGVNVDVPFTITSDGYTFPAGIDHLTAASVLPYVRQADVSEVGRAELQSNLIRAILDKIATDRMFVGTDWRVVHALAAAMSVDSNFSDSKLESLALRLGRLRGHDGVFITAPTKAGPGGSVVLVRRIAGKLWQAIRTDSVMRFAREFPQTVTPGAPA
jgi:LCP family protein required for cell wall assembly